MYPDQMQKITTSVKVIVESIIGFEVGEKESRHVVAEWDSLKYVEMIMIVQQQFSVSLSIPDIIEAESISDIVELIIRGSVK